MDKDLASGSLLSHYRIVSKIGEGGMGEVWLAEDTRLGRKVALKLLPTEFTEDSERVRRFTLEAKAASALNHPNIIAVYDIGECETGRFIVMEFVAGRTLRTVIAKDNSLGNFFTLGSQMARALSAAHTAGITHRDIKPDNIMVRDDGYVKMLDFGLARLLPATASDPEAMTLAQQTTPGTVMGTLAYMSPEQASGQPVGSPSDVFALGIVFYELATGIHPFKSETMIGYLHAITSQTPPSMTSINSHLPVALDDLILRMLEKDPGSRPTATEVVQALQEIEKYGSSNTLPFRVIPEKPKVSGAEEGFWVAVLPFKFTGSNPDVATLADGITEEIVTGLSRFSYLRVISRSSTSRFATETSDIRTIGTTLGARYVMEGSLRLAGSLLRLSVQLVDASTGAHLWVESYNRSFTSEQVFDLQDDLASRIVATVADMNGVLLHTMGEVLRQRDPNELTPYEAVLRGLAYISRADAEEHVKLRAALERAVVEAPDQSDCWSVLSMVYCDEDQHGFNVQPHSLDRALTAAQRATASGPANHLAHFSLASVLFFRRDFQSLSIAADRAIALNPMDATTMAFLGSFIAYSGDWERGCALAEKGMDLNPNHPGWFRFTSYFKEFAKGDYRAALEIALKMNMPGYFFINAALAAAYGQLGELENARSALRELLKQVPNFGQTARKDYEKWFGPGQFVEDLLNGLRKAGLDLAEVGSSSVTSSPGVPSSETRIDEGFWVAVLPFKATSTNTELSTLAEGLSDEIITGLNRFSYLRVIARSSTLRYASQTSDVRSLGKSLGARYLMEGNLRQAGTKMRFAVQLVDTTTGAHLWAENYERPFSPESIFELQDELVPRIVSTIADSHGVLPRSMSEAVQSRAPEELSPYEAVLRSFNYTQNVTPAALSDSVFCLELAVQKAPAYADAWAMLALMLVQDYAQGYNVRADSLKQAEEAARKAVELAPSNHLAWASLARVHFFQKEQQSFRNAVERAVALNSMDGDSHASLGEMLTFSGDADRGLELVERAKQLNPNHPGWYWYANFYQAYKQCDYRAALNFALKVNLPGHWAQPLFVAVASGQLDETESAAKALGKLLKLRPDVGETARKDFMKWWKADDVEHLLEGLRKAGLAVTG